MSDDPLRDASHGEMPPHTMDGHDDQIRADGVDCLEDFPGWIAEMDMDLVERACGQLVAAECLQFLIGTPEGKVMETFHVYCIGLSPAVTIVCEILGDEEEVNFRAVLVDEGLDVREHLDGRF